MDGLWNSWWNRNNAQFLNEINGLELELGPRRNHGVPMQRTVPSVGVGAGDGAVVGDRTGTSPPNELLLPSADPHHHHHPAHPHGHGILTRTRRHYFCHACQSRMENVNPDFTCPMCSTTGFVEAVEDFPTPLEEQHFHNHHHQHHHAAHRPPTEAEIGAEQMEIEPQLPFALTRRHIPMPQILHPIHYQYQVLLSNGHMRNNPNFGGLPPPPSATRPAPALRLRLKELKQVEVSEGDVEAQAQCCVCLQEFVPKESVSRLDCSHLFHNLCIVPWLELHGTCPLCRSNMIQRPPPRTTGPTTRQLRQRRTAQNGNGNGIGPNSMAAQLPVLAPHQVRELWANNLEQIAANTAERTRPVPIPVPAPVPVPAPAPAPVHALPGRRPGRRYQNEEGQAILDFIAERDLFEATGDNVIWRDMEMANVGGNSRSFRSLKDHFRKTVLPKLSEYNISAENARRLQGFISGQATAPTTTTVTERRAEQE